MASSALPTFFWNTKIDARGEYSDFAAAFHIALNRDGLGYLCHDQLVVERRIHLGEPPVLSPGQTTASKSYREDKKDFDARSDKVRIQKAAETDAFSKALAILLQLFDRKSGIYLSLVRVLKDTELPSANFKNCIEYIDANFKPNKADDAAELNPSLRNLHDSNGEGWNIFASTFIRNFEELIVLGSQPSEAEVNVIMRAAVRNPALATALTEYCILPVESPALPPGDSRTTWRVFLDKCDRILELFPLVDIKKQAYGANVSISAPYCNKCGRNNHTATHCDQTTCSRCSQPIIVNTYHECPRFIPNANSRHKNYGRGGGRGGGGRDGRGNNGGRGAQGRGNPPVKPTTHVAPGATASMEPILAAALESRKQARATINKCNAVIKKARPEEST